MEQLLAIAGAVVLMGNAGAMIYKWIRPALQLKQDVEELDRRTVNDFKAIKELEQTVRNAEKVNRTCLVVLLNTVNHMIDGNGIDELKATRADIEKLMAGIDE